MKSKVLFPILLLFVFFSACKEKSTKETAPGSESVDLPVKVKGLDVAYATDSVQMKGYLAFDENLSEKRPGVIIVHEWWGHNDYVRERANMLAELGYTALALDMYGDGKLAQHPDDAGKFAMSVITNFEVTSARFNAALDLLKDHETVDMENIAAIGYCFGGAVVLTMANSGADLDAVAAFHSGVQLPVMPTSDLKAKVLVCNGAEDPFIPPETVTAFKSAMDSVGASYQYIEYPGVQHSFTSKEADVNGEKFNLPLAYDAEADQKSWSSMQALFEEVFQ